jgi:hypothetical protein
MKRLLGGFVFAVLLVFSGAAFCVDDVEVVRIHVEKLHERDATGGKHVYLSIKADVRNRTDKYEVQVPIRGLDEDGNVVYTTTLIGDANPKGGHGHISGHATVPTEVYKKIHRWEGE